MISTPWRTRIDNANKYYENWSAKFKCDTLERYYECFQWKTKNVGYNPYTINLVYSTIKIKLATLIFQKPSFQLRPRPGTSQWDMDYAVQSSNIKQDVLNTIVSNPNANFTNHTKLATLDSFFRFGIVEIGYAADWRNPQKEAPLLTSWEDSDISEGNDRVLEENLLPVNERFFVKRINPRRFRVGLSDATDLNDHEWCGYYDYFYTSELKKTRGIQWPKNSPSGEMSADSAGMRDELPEGMDVGKVSKVWNIFDMVAHKRCLYLDTYLDEPLWESEIEKLPLVDLRWDLRLQGFYPIPPVFQWLSPQDEINEAREQTRSYRRRFTRKFQAVKGTVDEEEKEKFAEGPDGIIVETKQAGAITAIDNPEQGHTTENALLLAKDDFNIVSGTSAEARGQSDRETATQARLINARSQMRESADQLDYSNFICKIARELLVCAQERMSEGLWIKWTHSASDPSGQNDPSGPIYKFIGSQEINDGYDFEIDIDIINATPVAMAQQQQAYMAFVALVQNYPLIAMSADLIREAAYRVGYRNEKIIQRMQQASQMMQQQQILNQQSQQAGKSPSAGGGNSGNAAKEQIAQETPPDMAQIDQQIKQQLM